MTTSAVSWSAEFCHQVIEIHPLVEGDECMACGMAGADHGRPVASPCAMHETAVARLAELGEPVTR